MSGGFFCVNRAMFAHPLFMGNPERIAAWVWILGTAAWKDTRQNDEGRIVTVKRGQVLTSLRQMERATGVGVKVIRNLLKALESEGAIVVEQGHRGRSKKGTTEGTTEGTRQTLITVCNYDKYQMSPKEEGTTSGAGQDTRGAQEGHTKEEDNTSVSKDTGASAPVDPAKIMFDTGIAILTEAGVSEKTARSQIGMWKRDHGVTAVIDAIGRACREGATEPRAFITKVLQAAGKASGHAAGRSSEPEDWERMVAISEARRKRDQEAMEREEARRRGEMAG